MRGINVEAGRMHELVEELLLLARLDEGRPLVSKPLDLNEVVVDAIAAARAVAPDRKITLRVRDVVMVSGDAGRLRQVFDNLLANVRTHTPPDTVTAIELRTDGPLAVVTIRDNGPGMTTEQAHRVFERFFRADSSRSRSSGGSGLGLAIVHSIVTAHGGSVRVETAPGKGFGLVITLPLLPGGSEPIGDE
jgi:two-component system OmpR family sensor kinase